MRFSGHPRIPKFSRTDEEISGTWPTLLVREHIPLQIITQKASISSPKSIFAKNFQTTHHIFPILLLTKFYTFQNSEIPQNFHSSPHSTYYVLFFILPNSHFEDFYVYPNIKY